MTTTSSNRPGRARSKSVEPVRALDRGLEILNVLAESGGGTLSEVSKAAGLVPSTVYRLLETMVHRGYVTYDSGKGRYALGIRTYEVGHAFTLYDRLIEAARSEMENLAAKTTEGVNLAVLDRQNVVYIHHEEGTGMMRLFTHKGARAPVYCTGVGKCLLAWLPEDRWKHHLPEEPFPAFTPYTVSSKEEFFRLLHRVPAQGYATDEEEREEGVSCVTVPVRDPGGAVVAALSISGPTTRIQRRGIPALAAHLSSASDHITTKLPDSL